MPFLRLYDLAASQRRQSSAIAGKCHRTVSAGSLQDSAPCILATAVAVSRLSASSLDECNCSLAVAAPCRLAVRKAFSREAPHHPALVEAAKKDLLAARVLNTRRQSYARSPVQCLSSFG